MFFYIYIYIMRNELLAKYDSSKIINLYHTLWYYDNGESIKAGLNSNLECPLITIERMLYF